MSAQPLPPAVPVLYGVSEYVLPKPGYWPDAVTFCGYSLRFVALVHELEGHPAMIALHQRQVL
eukprot:51237-Eustigmatos_ZCMA.PRE.1